MEHMQEELEVALDSASEGEGSQPDWLKDKVVSVDNAAKRHRSKTPGPSHPDSEVQDLTGILGLQTYCTLLLGCFDVLAEAGQPLQRVIALHCLCIASCSTTCASPLLFVPFLPPYVGGVNDKGLR